MLGALGLALASPQDASGDWASAQSSRGVRIEPNDFWYWHKIGPSGNGKSPPLLPTDIVYDPEHTYQWILGDNYLNMPRAWAISRCDQSENPPVIVTADTEMMVGHPDLNANMWMNRFEVVDGVDNDGNSVVDDIYSVIPGFTTGTVFSNGGVDSLSALRHVKSNPSEQHGTNMLSVAVAVTDNEGWWQGREYADYIQELPDHVAGIAGIAWNAKLVFGEHMAEPYILPYVENLVRKGVNIRVASCSWTGRATDWVRRMEAMGILVISGGDNINWLASEMSADQPCGVAGAIEYDYRRSRFDGPEDGSSYKPNELGSRLSFVGYTPYGGGWFNWGTNKYISVTGNSMIWTLGWVNIEDDDSYEELDVAEKALFGIPGYGVPNYTDRWYDFVGGKYHAFVPGIMPSQLRTSGTTPQAAGIAALIFAKYPHLRPAQVLGMIRRGCVNVDAYNTNTCCASNTKSQCFTWVDENGNGIMEDGGFYGPGEITGRIEGASCTGLLGAGRLDAYRALTLWGKVSADTTLTGDVYVSGDVLIGDGVTVTVSPGTRFFIAPDDITQLDQWNPESQYDMNGGTAGGQYSAQTSPVGKIEITFESATSKMVIVNSLHSGVVFDSFVNDAQTANDWIGLNVFNGSSIVDVGSKLQVLHSTNGVY